MLKNAKQYYICIVVDGILWSASPEINKADSGESDEVYFQDHVLPILLMRVDHTFLHFVCTI